LPQRAAFTKYTVGQNVREELMHAPTITLIGGPTALIEIGGFRFLTDPTFDGPGEYRLPYVTLTTTSRPAIALSDIGPIDAVLLSHEQHADNLDNSRRDLLGKAPCFYAGRRRQTPRRPH
jgi:L-ascorbate metabolism protein UlaG (beta-lactamase superfamily)